MKQRISKINGMLPGLSAHRDSMRNTLIVVGLLALWAVLTWALPALPGTRGIAGYLPLHTLFETIAIAVSILVFAVGWNAHSDRLPGNMVLVSCAFLGVGMLNFAHMLSYAGMPDFVTPNSPERAIGFWLIERLLATVALLAAVIMPQRPFASASTRYLLLAAAIAVTAFTYWLLLFHQDALPHTFIPGQGLTAFKIASEYAIIALNLAAASVLWARRRTPRPFNASALFGAACAMALGEFFFTLYVSVTDVFNLFGHVYVVIAYLFVYRAIFVAAIKAPYRQLQLSEAKLRGTLDAIPDPVWLKDADGVYLECNATFERLYGAGKADIIGKTDYDFVDRKLADFIREHDRMAVIAGKPSISEECLDFADGGYRGLFETVKTPIYADAGKLIGVLGIARDISGRKQAEDEISRLNIDLEHRVSERTRQLESANKELEAFSYSVSHDLRSPLRSIDGFSRVLLQNYHAQLDPTGKDWLERICRASQRMGNLIDDMLLLSQVARSPLRRETVNLSNIAENVADELRKTFPVREVRFILQDDLIIYGDSGLLRVVIDNLLGNAWKYTGKKSGAEIEFGAREINGEATFFVRDNGTGFDMNYAHKLFGPFQRLHGLDEFEGTGIGLATVQRIIHRHYGKVWADAIEGQGATFYFTLPQRERGPWHIEDVE